MADCTGKEDLYWPCQVVQILVFILYSCFIIIFIWLPPSWKESKPVTNSDVCLEEPDHVNVNGSNREEALDHMGGQDGMPSGNHATVIREFKESLEPQFQDNKEKSCFEFEKQQNPTNPVDSCCDGCVCRIGARLRVMHTNPTNFCDECGAPYLRETSKFCSKCGIKRLGKYPVVLQFSMVTEEINKLRNDISELKRYKNEEAGVGVASGTVVQELESSLAKKGDY